VVARHDEGLQADGSGDVIGIAPQNGGSMSPTLGGRERPPPSLPAGQPRWPTDAVRHFSVIATATAIARDGAAQVRRRVGGNWAVRLCAYWSNPNIE
jgi:hypothetical protein